MPDLKLAILGGPISTIPPIICAWYSQLGYSTTDGVMQFSRAPDYSHLPFFPDGLPMTIYVDNVKIKWAGSEWCHLVADSLDELHSFA
ncbi:DUF4031 domain-containing protein, partial [Pseudomonas viridiflava]|uniref:DUF4031 domain-containing protein n=1 Tax=Pseudomonas viridiflava TaxID=33069 RepID=UPI00311D56CD